MASMKSSRRTLSELPMLTTRQGATGERLSPSMAATELRPRAAGGTASISRAIARTKSST